MVAAYIMLRFPQRWTHKTSTNIEVTRLAWAIDDRGAWGALAFGEDFIVAYDAAVTMASANELVPDDGPILTTWPESKENRHLHKKPLIDQVVRAGRCVEYTGAFHAGDNCIPIAGTCTTDDPPIYIATAIYLGTL